MSAPFSYAQAAKSRPSPSLNASASPSASSPQLKGTTPTSANESKQSWAEDSTDTSTIVDDGLHSAQNSQSVTSGEVNLLDSQVTSTAKPQAPSHEATSTAPKESMDVLHNDDSDAAAPSIPLDDQHLEKATDTEESKGTQNGVDDSPWNEEKGEANTAIPQSKALKAAPPPAVNFWTQRAQTLKAKQEPKPSTSLNGSQQPTRIADGPSAGKIPQPQTKAVQATAGEVANATPRNTQQGHGKQSHTRQHNGSVHPALPAIKDEISWPTPESAQDETRKRSQDKSDKPETERAPSATRPHGKNEWKHVPFTPTVKFNTPMPSTSRRGGRGGNRGGRDSGGRGGPLSTSGNDKASATDAQSETSSKAQIEGANGTSDSLKERRSASESQASARDGKSVPHNETGKRPSLQEGVAGASPTGRQSGASRRAKPVLDRIAPPVNGTSAEALDDKSASDVVDPGRRRSSVQAGDSSSHGPVLPKQKQRNAPLSAPVERTSESMLPPKLEDELHKENNTRQVWPNKPSSTSNRLNDGSRSQPLESGPLRDRGDSRPERGRGGRSGRGGYGHHPNSQHPSASSFANGNTPTTPHSATFSRFAPNFPPPFSPGPNHSSHNSRSYRPTPRSSSIPNEVGGRYTSGPMPPVYASSPTYGSGYEMGMPSITPLPYPMPIMYDHMALVNDVAYQLNYYFSLDNLIKDTFLRKQMDSQGFVLLSLVANFKKMKQLTSDINLIKMVCSNLEQFELQHGVDDNDRIRKKDGWEQWILPMDQRDAVAQHDGIEPKEPPKSPNPAAIETMNPFAAPGIFMPSAEVMFPPGNHTANLTTPSVASPVNGSMSPMPRNNRYSLPLMDSDLYRPAASPVGPNNSTTNGQSDELDAFPDEQVDHLTVVARPENHTGKQPRHSEASRTFSNGSIDALGIETQADEERKSRSRLDVIGGTEAERSSRFSSPQGLSSSTSPDPSRRNSVGLFWIKNKDNAPVPMPEGSASEPYSHLHFRALQQRQTAEPSRCPHDMQILYQFWSHFLIRNFNTKMYEEFHQYAHEDSATDCGSDGMDNLIKYYKESLSSQHIIRERVAKDFIDLVNSENKESGRPAFKQLKAAWRDGALNMRNRKKLSDIIEPGLKADLDK